LKAWIIGLETLALFKIKYGSISLGVFIANFTTMVNYKKLSFAALLLLSGNQTFAQYFTEHTPDRQTIATGPGTSTTYTTRLLQLNQWRYTEPEKPGWTKTVWRDVDTREKANAPFSNASEIEGQTTLASMLLDGIFKGVFNVYEGSDKHFTTALSKKDFISLIFSKGSLGLNSEKVMKYRIQEEWAYVKSKKTVLVKMTGIAPLTAIKGTDGVIRDVPVFWVSYPEAKEYIAAHKAVIPGESNTYNWGRYLYGRNFSSKMIKEVWQYQKEDTDHLSDMYK
jgi:Gliding motility associated protein GldN